jgi:hypothetical protein
MFDIFGRRECRPFSFPVKATLNVALFSNQRLSPTLVIVETPRKHLPMTATLSNHDPRTGHLVGGNSAWRAKKDRLAARTEQLCAEYDAQPQILAIVASHLDDAERSRSALTRTRALNVAMRMLRTIPRKAPKRPANAKEWYKNGAK